MRLKSGVMISVSRKGNRWGYVLGWNESGEKYTERSPHYWHSLGATLNAAETEIDRRIEDGASWDDMSFEPGNLTERTFPQHFAAWWQLQREEVNRRREEPTAHDPDQA